LRQKKRLKVIVVFSQGSLFLKLFQTTIKNSKNKTNFVLVLSSYELSAFVKTY